MSSRRFFSSFLSSSSLSLHTLSVLSTTPSNEPVHILQAMMMQRRPFSSTLSPGSAPQPVPSASSASFRPRRAFSASPQPPTHTSEDGQPRTVPILESLFPGRGVSHKDLLPRNYEPPGGPVTDRVYMDLTIGDKPAGRVVFGLYGRYLPLTARNFRALATGQNEEGKCYRGALLHRVIKDLFIQGGDIVFNNGTGSWSIFGPTFEDELKDFLFTKPGLLAMANFHGQPNSNGCQFFVTLTALEYLDRKCVVFGEVLEGFEVLKAINDLETDLLDRPRPPVLIADSGLLDGLDEE